MNGVKSSSSTRTSDLPVSLVIRHTDVGIVVPVRVIPLASRTGLASIRDKRLLVCLIAPPSKGAVNQPLAKAFDLPKHAVRIVRGAHAREKSVLIQGVRPEAVFAQLTREP